MKTYEFYIMRAIYAVTSALIVGIVLGFIFLEIRDYRDYTLAKQLQDYNMVTGFQAYY